MALLTQKKISQLFFIKYALIGIICASIDWLIFTLLVNEFHFSLFLANLISTHIGIFLSFTLNLRINFVVKDKIFNRFIFFYSIGFIGYIFGHFMIHFLVNNVYLSPSTSKIFSCFGVFLIQFTLNKLITFKKSKQNEN
jgi:putative flippase GtrA